MIIKKYIQHDKPWCKTSPRDAFWEDEVQFYDLGTTGKIIPETRLGSEQNVKVTSL